MEVPPNHSLVLTKDNSLSLFNETFQEGLHSVYGAKSETIYNFIEGCEILNHQASTLSILEVGFGCGMGFFTTLEYLKFSKVKKLYFLSLELDGELTKWALRGHPYKEEESNIRYSGNNFDLVVCIGDATKVLPKLNEGPFDAIYHDPFSPKKNPSLWTVEWFSMLKSQASPECILSTYSSSTSVRSAMVNAGWSVFNRKGFSVKKNSTIATLQGNTSPQLLKKLDRHTLSRILPV